MRHGLLYVLRNGAKHGVVEAHARDDYSSAAYFDGFANGTKEPMPNKLLAKATAWIFTTGWRKIGLIRRNEVPASRAVRPLASA